MKTSSAKAKGRNFQKWTRDQLLDRFNTLEPADILSTSMGAGGADLKLSPAAQRLIPLSFECKAHKSFAVYKIMDQAAANSPQGIEPISVIKADRKKPLVVIDAEYFFDLLAQSNV